MIITVTEKHIRNALPDDCPLRLAIKEKFPKLLVSVGLNYVFIGCNRYELTEGMKYFIDCVDLKIPVDSFVFELKLSMENSNES